MIILLALFCLVLKGIIILIFFSCIGCLTEIAKFELPALAVLSDWLD